MSRDTVTFTNGDGKVLTMSKGDKVMLVPSPGTDEESRKKFCDCKRCRKYGGEVVKVVEIASTGVVFTSDRTSEDFPVSNIIKVYHDFVGKNLNPGLFSMEEI